MKFNKNYWENRYKEKKTGWDLGKISKPLKNYIDQLDNKNLHILIPGSGNGYEAEYLFKKNFKNIYYNDVSKLAIKNFKNRVPSFPKTNILDLNFFDINEKFDLIIEQTFFCALDPLVRQNYINKINDLIRNNGKLVGLFFDDIFKSQEPPFGFKKKNYTELFNKFLNIKTFELCYNSELPREGNEFFCIAQKSS